VAVFEREKNLAEWPGVAITNLFRRVLGLVLVLMPSTHMQTGDRRFDPTNQEVELFSICRAQSPARRTGSFASRTTSFVSGTSGPRLVP
jgi:hypothetical protein